MTAVASITLHPDPRLSVLSRPAIRRQLFDYTERVAARSRQIAPRRSGTMAGNITTSYTDGGGEVNGAPVVARSRVTVRVPYAVFVLKGTSTPILPKHGPYMHNPSEGIFYRTRVRGQAANNFLLRAAKATR